MLVQYSPVGEIRAFCLDSPPVEYITTLPSHSMLLRLIYTTFLVSFEHFKKWAMQSNLPILG